MEELQKKRREEIEAWKAKQEAIRYEDAERKKRQERVINYILILLVL
jgi:hypothetical protein